MGAVVSSGFEAQIKGVEARSLGVRVPGSSTTSSTFAASRASWKSAGENIANGTIAALRDGRHRLGEDHTVAYVARGRRSRRTRPSSPTPSKLERVRRDRGVQAAGAGQIEDAWAKASPLLDELAAKAAPRWVGVLERHPTEPFRCLPSVGPSRWGREGEQAWWSPFPPISGGRESGGPGGRGPPIFLATGAAERPIGWICTSLRALRSRFCLF